MHGYERTKRMPNMECIMTCNEKASIVQHCILVNVYAKYTETIEIVTLATVKMNFLINPIFHNNNKDKL